MSKQEQEILNIEGCVVHVRANFKTLYPVQPKKRKHTFGNIPDALHKQIVDFAAEHNVTIAEAIASLWDFLSEYEGEFEAELEKHRANPKSRRA